MVLPPARGLVVDASAEALTEDPAKFRQAPHVEKPHDSTIGLSGAHAEAVPRPLGSQTRLAAGFEQRAAELNEPFGRILQRAEDPVFVVWVERSTRVSFARARSSFDAVGISTLQTNHSIMSRATGTPASVNGNSLRPRAPPWVELSRGERRSGRTYM